jgi:RNA recognition motif-containing protein
MVKRLYVGNLPFSTTSEQLKEIFIPYGPIQEVEIVTFKDTGRSKGFGFVTFSDESNAEKAKQEMNNKEVQGRKIFVNDATPFDANKPRPQKRRFNKEFSPRENQSETSKNFKEKEVDEEELENF